jgi:dTDP-4-dehydrorhamnose 3,5-epimerase
VSDRFDITATALKGVQVIQRKPIGDSRGFLERLFCANELQALMGGSSIIQINHTLTARRGTVRGMHFQRPPHAEMKLVSCLRGEVFDVALDLRDGSPTFLKWHAEVLSATNHKTLLIPEGVAHGFQALSDDCEMLYFHTAAYHPGAEDGLHPADPRLAIQWPLELAELSARDAAHAKVTESFSGVKVRA